MEINNNNISEINTGLHTDTSPQNQPKGTYRFGLNTVNETDKGDEFFRSNEESNQVCITFPEDFIPIGKIYIGENETVIFLVSKDNNISEIGILKNNCTYETHVNDMSSEAEDKLGFNIKHQISGTYRLRRGCERTIYFTDDFNKPRYFNFDKPQNFKNKDNNNTWNSNNFNLQKTYNKIPELQSVKVLDSGGNLEPGSYNIAIQYVDESLNPSEWIYTTNTINIYNSLSSNSFLDINGSINSDVSYINFKKTSKAIYVEFGELDTNYSFYRLAFIEASSGNGLITSVKYTDVITTSQNNYTYTGDNNLTFGTAEEILQFSDIIERAGSIEQIENRLLLANTQGKQFDFCKLQKYASRIKTDCITKKVILNNVNNINNPKNPTNSFGDLSTGGRGYMPGEIYSFGIVYVFEDNTLSPVYHIPGRNHGVSDSTVYSPGANTHAMMKNNESDSLYIDNESCYDYWGLDSEGMSITNTKVRHHRFPLRSEIDLPLVQEENNGGQQNFYYYKIKVVYTGEIDLPITCTEEEITNNTCTPQEAPIFKVRVTYTVNGNTETFVFDINPSILSNPINGFQFSTLYDTNNIVITKIEEIDENDVATEIINTTSPKGLNYTTTIEETVNETETKVFSTQILGIKFSGIDIPSIEDTNGVNIIGYYIVRNERVENEKTILDTGVLIPTIVNSKYISTGLLNPEHIDYRINKNIFGLINPEYKFNNKEFNNISYIKQEGNYVVTKINRSKTLFNDVQNGSSYNSEIHKSGNDDGDTYGNSPTPDGWCLKTIFRDNILKYFKKTLFNILNTDVKSMFYLKSLENKDIEDSSSTIFNIAADNKICIVHTKTDIVKPLENRLPYVIIGKENSNSYANFRTSPYYKESLNIEKIDSDTISIFNGDTYVSPMRYTNTMFWDNKVAYREFKKDILDIVVVITFVILGTLAIVLSVGLAAPLVLGAGISLIGGAALFAASAIEAANIIKAYNQLYGQGLRETTLDKWVRNEYGYGNQQGDCIIQECSNDWSGYDGPTDDEIQWVSDTLTDLWFESSVNISLRNKFSEGDSPTFLDAPGVIETGNTSPELGKDYYGNHYWRSYTKQPISKLEYHVNKKLLYYTPDRKDSRGYIGHPLGEYYNVNPDYHRINKEKVYYHLPLEYDCCSNCKEDFPHRIHYSEQSYQEELSDNYRIFLPNNYKDLEGETGEITNTFKIGNDLFMHTKEALWQIPRNYQERVTDQIVSFIGTGSYFEIPPRKILDDDTGSSAGTQHKWSTIKTPQGIFFVSENERKIYQFNGQQLKPISEVNMSSWFQNNIELLMNKQYYNSTSKNYPYNDNPSNPFGIGFITTYDTSKKRLLFTKKDFTPNPLLIENPDFEVQVCNGEMIYFPNFNQIIAIHKSNGWNYVGIEDCKMKFEKLVTNTKTEIRGTTEVEIDYIETIYKYVEGTVLEDPIENNNSWTMSYSLKQNDWVSWHSYLPNFYINVPDKFYSWIYGDNNLWEHNKKGHYQTFYGKLNPFILEYVSLSNPLTTRIWEYLMLLVEVKKFNPQMNEFVDINNTFFNKMIVYNSRQCSGLMNIKVKDSNEDSDYLFEQINNLSNDEVIVDRNERTWTINNLRDIRTNYTEPIFISDLTSLQTEYFIDKVLNNNSIDYEKDWTELESFRDKYLVIRLIFDNFAQERKHEEGTIKMIMNFSGENESQSFR